MPGKPGDWSHEDPSEVIATLLHEMCHAVFRLYACRYCCKASGPGFTDHGAAWLSLAYAAQEGLRRSFAGLENVALDVYNNSGSVRKELEVLKQYGLWTDRWQLRRQALAYQGQIVI